VDNREDNKIIRDQRFLMLFFKMIIIVLKDIFDGFNGKYYNCKNCNFLGSSFVKLFPVFRNVIYRLI